MKVFEENSESAPRPICPQGATLCICEFVFVQSVSVDNFDLILQIPTLFFIFFIPATLKKETTRVTRRENVQKLTANLSAHLSTSPFVALPRKRKVKIFVLVQPSYQIKSGVLTTKNTEPFNVFRQDAGNPEPCLLD